MLKTVTMSKKSYDLLVSDCPIPDNEIVFITRTEFDNMQRDCDFMLSQKDYFTERWKHFQGALQAKEVE